MRDAVTIKKVKHPRYRFTVNYPEQLPDGAVARRKTYFVIRSEADAFAAEKRAEVASHGARHSHVTSDERAALIRFRSWNEAKTESVSLLALINEAISARERTAIVSTSVLQPNSTIISKLGYAPGGWR